MDKRNFDHFYVCCNDNIFEAAINGDKMSMILSKIIDCPGLSDKVVGFVTSSHFRYRTNH